MLRKKIIGFTICLFLFSNLNAQDQTLDFLKVKPHDSIPTFEETLKYLNEQWIKKNNFGCIMEKPFRLYPISSDSLFEYDSKKNTLNFNLTIVPSGKAWGTEDYYFTILLDNVDPNSLVNKSARISFMSFDNRKLGFYIKQKNGRSCRYNVVDISTFQEIEFIKNCSYSQNTKPTTEQIRLAFKHLLSLKTSKEKLDGCEACLIYNTKIETKRNQYMPINQLKYGDTITSYNNINGQYFQTTITGIDSIYHNNLVELYYDNDTIICTDDHPFLIEKKGWCSLNPKKTMQNYSNYPKVNLLENGDLFLSNSDNGISTKQLNEIKYLNKGEMTYTITGLKKGNTYFANGILTGIELLKKPF